MVFNIWKLSDWKKNTLRLFEYVQAPGLIHLIDGLKIDSLLNALTLTHGSHRSFSEFQIYFKPTVNLYEYTINSMEQSTSLQKKILRDLKEVDVRADRSTNLGLRELYLDNCTILQVAIGWSKEDLETYYPILLSEEWKMFKRKNRRKFYHYKYPRRWHDYFTMFRTGLPFLQHFRIGESSWGRGFPSEKDRDITIGLFKGWYFHWGEAYATVNSTNEWPYEMRDLPFCQVEDNEALYVLFRKIGQSLGERNWIR
ncbi:hypothetical protein EMCG_03791 [[Emmonsia] crescens]|uniref:Uncharacterized protein n=1 Tax=[Emmonsia] crescens TaxID=73230 RepID=A0A0G2HU35_9EURO|nr:hypothetical protein EMCG_03791 [Emmonsia crescens UAMH 3008]